MQKTTQTGRITSIEPMGTWSNGQATFNKFRVGFANGDILSFLAKDNFKKNVGDDITYEKNPAHGTGKVVYEKPSFNQSSSYNQPTQKTIDTQEKIVRQSMLKAAVDFHATNHGKTEQQVLQTAQLFIDFINQ
jgi:hypothetical protein